ncbi:MULTISPECIES: DUF4334 domain-containing protein [Mycolicibacter]|uniref:DUF4334 domain-containing protein n=1 Tax=Mycolicibacter virginiensis TaxID=1795032 RepID=A0A9X7IM21_9MYCO|nr:MULTISPECIES: DUF4334 domain-containing protein [Mycobacteriaceae]OBJ29013.1 hypothetical protein A5631_18935 [Mycolicibacter heraklionensis]PQM51717.1 DUF4334 domain-containing protein [Mycolicibacter virginiensis]ULP46186.1 DUF4334 domain-containing protein [Mycolicibacter virginiensis]
MAVQDLFSNVPTTTAEACEIFDAAEAVDPDFMVGTWHGSELPTGHPLDGLLAATGWWGKQFVDAETVHPLLFPTRDGDALWAFNPVLAFSVLGLATKLPALKNRSFLGQINALQPLLRTRSPRARLRITRYRGVDSATMVYDQAPVNDVFRRLSEDAVIGAMDLRGSSRPYFFVLCRDDSLKLA